MLSLYYCCANLEANFYSDGIFLQLSLLFKFVVINGLNLNLNMYILKNYTNLHQNKNNQQIQYVEGKRLIRKMRKLSISRE